MRYVTRKTMKIWRPCFDIPGLVNYWWRNNYFGKANIGNKILWSEKTQIFPLEMQCGWHNYISHNINVEFKTDMTTTKYKHLMCLLHKKLNSRVFKNCLHVRNITAERSQYFLFTLNKPLYYIVHVSSFS